MSKELCVEERVDSSKMTDMLDAIYSKAINRIPKVSRAVDDIVKDYMSKYDDPKVAAKELAKYQIAKCGTSGFLSGLGGIITLPVAVPANVGSVLYVQMRMIAAIAQMGGFNIRSDQVQTMVYACLTGTAVTDVIKQTGIKVSEKISETALSQIPVQVLNSINSLVGFKLIATLGSVGAINLGELIPVAGGVIGGAFDVVSTRIIADNAISLFIDKKVPEPKKKFSQKFGDAAKSVKKAVTPMASSLKNKYDVALAERKHIKMIVKKVIPPKTEDGKLCHVIIVPKRILISWDFFTDEFGNHYVIENAAVNPSATKRKAYEYYVEFSDSGIEFPSGTILYAGEDKWKKNLPECAIKSIEYYVANLPSVQASEAPCVIGPENAELIVNLDKEGQLSVQRTSKNLSNFNYKLGKKSAKKVFEDLRDCISDGESKPFDAKDALTRMLVLNFENGQEIEYNEVRGVENGTTTRDIISKLLKLRGLNAVV